MPQRSNGGGVDEVVFPYRRSGAQNVDLARMPCPEQKATPVDAASDVIREIDGAMEEIDRLTRKPISAEAFYSEFLRLASVPVEATASAVWRRGPSGDMWLAATWASGSQRVTRPFVASEQRRLAGLSAGQLVEVDSPLGVVTAVSTPVQLGEQLAGVVAIYVPPSVPEDSAQGYLEYAATIADFAARFEQRQGWSSLLANQGEWLAFERFVLNTHRAADVQAVASEVAHEAVPLLGADRVSVAVRRGAKFQLIAATGVAMIDRRSQTVKELESVVAAVSRHGETIICQGDISQLPPQIGDDLMAYMDRSAVQSIVVVPLRTAGSPDSVPSVAALVVENFSASISAVPMDRLSLVSEHAAVALERAVRCEQLPGYRLLTACAPLWQAANLPRISRWTVGLLLLAAFATTLLLWPVRFRVTMRGHMQPTELKHLFAPADGVARAIHVQQGSQVEAGQALITVESPELDWEWQRLLGEMATARQRLQAIDAERLQQRLVGASDVGQEGALSSEELVLKDRLASLEAQWKILEAQRAELEVTSPISGTVLTWEIEKVLADRPVLQGQALMTVANLAGPWTLRFYVPDEDAGHLLRSQAVVNDLQLTYLLASNPGERHYGTLSRIDWVTQVRDDQRATVLVEADLNSLSGLTCRPGASVVGRVDCGQRSLGFVWFHRLGEQLRRFLF